MKKQKLRKKKSVGRKKKKVELGVLATRHCAERGSKATKLASDSGKTLQSVSHSLVSV